LHIWATNDETSRLLAFVCIHKMATLLPYPFIELCLKVALRMKRATIVGAAGKCVAVLQ
jgi:hypothetical protein